MSSNPSTTKERLPKPNQTVKKQKQKQPQTKTNKQIKTKE
jgi:hypothetical protein